MAKVELEKLGGFMVKKVSGQSPTPPISHPPSVGRAGISSELAKVSKRASQFVTNGRGKSYLGAGKPPEYSESPPRGSKTVSTTATGLILPNKKARH
jgi:hypothetical protein